MAMVSFKILAQELHEWTYECFLNILALLKE
jgi:hypothetical protein